MTEKINYQAPMLQLDALDGQATAVLKALASAPRLRILDLLSDKVLNVSEIADALGMPLSTANLHISSLEEVGLLKTELRPGNRGLQKTCARVYDSVLIQLPHATTQEDRSVEMSMPVGAYADAQVSPTCGMAGQNGIIGLLDDPRSFYEPERVNAQLLWFSHGHVEYRFPNRLPPKVQLISLQLNIEICSEAPLHHDDWPSDITLWINDVEIGTWTSPQDFGGQRGALTPDWWESYNTQYGLMKSWQITDEGSFIDGLRISDVVLSALKIKEQGFISARIGVKADARHVGGINLFGRHFGNYPQDIILRLRFV